MSGRAYFFDFYWAAALTSSRRGPCCCRLPPTIATGRMRCKGSRANCRAPAWRHFQAWPLGPAARPPLRHRRDRCLVSAQRSRRRAAADPHFKSCGSEGDTLATPRPRARRWLSVFLAAPCRRLAHRRIAAPHAWHDRVHTFAVRTSGLRRCTIQGQRQGKGEREGAAAGWHSANVCYATNQLIEVPPNAGL
jgi:hypothetical protein